MAKAPETIVHESGGALAYVAVVDPVTRDEGIGTSFHIGGGIFVTAAHVIEGKEIVSVTTTRPTFDVDRDGWRRVRVPAASAVSIERFRHSNPRVDVACVRTELRPAHISLLVLNDDVLDDMSFVLQSVIVMGWSCPGFVDTH